MKKEIALVIPAYRAHKTIRGTLSSINIQSYRDRIHVYISDDEPKDDYSAIIKDYPELEITEIKTDTNRGPGVARNRGIDAATEDYIMFMDADDILYTPYSVELLYRAVKQPNTIQAQGVFLQEATSQDGNQHGLIPIENPNHPWSFGRLTNTQFLKTNGINFGTLRAMEDGRFQTCIRLLTEGTQLKTNFIKDMVYVWKTGSEHSITRTGTDLNGGIPLYNYSLCQMGATVAAKEAIEFANSRNPFNGNIQRYCVEQLVSRYFTYYECLEKCPKFAEENWWLGKYFYHECFAKYCQNIKYDILDKMYMQALSAKGMTLSKSPELTFKQWYDRIATEKYELNEIVDIRSRIPENIRKAEEATGVVTEDILELFAVSE